MELVGNPAGEDRLVSVYQKLCITYRGFRFHLVKKGASKPFQVVSTMSRVTPQEDQPENKRKDLLQCEKGSKELNQNTILTVQKADNKSMEDGEGEALALGE